MDLFRSINPYNGELLQEFELDNTLLVDKKVQNASVAFSYWSSMSISERNYCFEKLGAVLLQNKQNYARLISMEMGKVYDEALAEVEKCAFVCRFYSQHASSFFQDELVKSEAKLSKVVYQPLGTILGIMPWNFPFWQVFRFAVPTLSIGNTVLLKHAPNVQSCALAIEEAFRQAGFPEGTFQNLKVKVDAVEALLGDSRVKGVSLTGSERAGRAVASAAGSNIKRSVLELGGNDAFIVLKDADVEKAVGVGLQSRFQNAGQVCISAKRFLVEKDVKDAFVQEMLKRLPEWMPGDPFSSHTKMGPMARIDLAETIELQYKQTLAAGAKPLTEFKRNDCLVHPMVLDGVVPTAVAFKEETFGPLAAITTVEGELDAVAQANESRFGLAATIFTKDVEKAEKMALKLNTGMVFVNEQVRSDPRFPIGGNNNSGYGRELSHFGVKEFSNAKTIYMA